MSTQKDKNYADTASLHMLSSQPRVVGAKQIRKAMNAGTAKQVFLARNADPAITESIETACQQQNIAYAWVRSMTELGNVCGIEVGAAAAAIVS